MIRIPMMRLPLALVGGYLSLAALGKAIEPEGASRAFLALGVSHLAAHRVLIGILIVLELYCGLNLARRNPSKALLTISTAMFAAFVVYGTARSFGGGLQDCGCLGALKYFLPEGFHRSQIIINATCLVILVVACLDKAAPDKPVPCVP